MRCRGRVVDMERLHVLARIASFYVGVIRSGGLEVGSKSKGQTPTGL